jgi:hypothetical protein
MVELDADRSAITFPEPCVSCKHWRLDRTCAAFPRGIPDAIWTGENMHRTPVSGDSGIVYEPVAGSAKTAPILDTTELVSALRSATEALLHGQPQQAD